MAKKTFPLTITVNVPEAALREIADYASEVLYDDYLIEITGKKVLNKPGVQEAMRSWLENWLVQYVGEVVEDVDSYDILNLDKNNAGEFLESAFAAEIQRAKEKAEKEEAAAPVYLGVNVPREKKAEAIALLKKLGGKLQ